MKKSCYALLKCKAILPILLFGACSPIQKKDYKDLDLFLKKDLSFNALNTYRYIWLVSGLGCKGCMDQTFRFASRYHKEGHLFVFPRSGKAFDYTRGGNTVLIDSTNEINRLRFHKGTIGLARINDQEIEDIQILNVDNVDSALRSFTP